jgi:two-component system KDP operon response regulator KdpE
VLHGKKILVIDDPDLLELTRLVFSRAGAEVHTALDGREGVCRFGACDPDLVLLDIMMPNIDGWETCRLLRRLSGVPIIFLTALNQEQEIVRGLDCGAVDYITKPFSAEVLLARARVALRTAHSASETAKPTIYDDGYLVVNVEEHRVFVDGRPVQLTATEYRLLTYLLENRGRVLTYEQILGRVWGWEYRECVDYVHVYVWHLRRKLEPNPRHPAYVLTERGVGYRFKAQKPRRKGYAA